MWVSHAAQDPSKTTNQAIISAKSSLDWLVDLIVVTEQ